MLIAKAITAKTTNIVQKQMHKFSCLAKCNSVEIIFAIFTSSIFSVHSSAELRSTNSSTNSFLHLQFSQSNYSPISHDFSHLHSQLLGFQIVYFSHIHLSINYLHSHLSLSLFQRCLLLQTLASNLYLHLHVSCHSMCLVSLVLDIKNLWSYFNS